MDDEVEFTAKAEFWIDRDLSAFEQSFFRTVLINFCISRKITYEARYLFEPSTEESEGMDESGTNDGGQDSESTEATESASTEASDPPKQPRGFIIRTTQALHPLQIQLIANKLSLTTKRSVTVSTWPRHPPPPVGWDRLSDGEWDEDDVSAKHPWCDSDSNSSDTYTSDTSPTPETTPITTPEAETPRADWQGCDTDPRDRQNWQSRWAEDTPCKTDIDEPQPIGPVYLRTVPWAAEMWQDAMVFDWQLCGRADAQVARWREVYKLAAAHAASYALAEARPRRRVRWADGVVSPLEWNTTPVIVARYHAPSPTGLDGLDYRLRRAFNF